MDNYIYVYLDPRKPGKYKYNSYCFNYEPFYIGKGSNKRMYDHLKGNKHNKHLERKIRKIQKECNYDPYINLYKDMLNEETSFILERDMIKSIGRMNLKTGPLCNLTDGGEGLKGYIPTIECKRRNSESHIGILQSDETRKKKSISLSGKKFSESHKKEIGKSHSKFWKIIDPFGQIFNIFNLREFCRNNNLDQSKMCAVSLGKRKTYKRWLCYKLLAN